MADGNHPSGDLYHEKEKEERGIGDVSPGVVAKVDETILKHSRDADAAMKAFEGMEGQTVELSEEANRRLLRKIDRHLMPVSGFCCLGRGVGAWCGYRVWRYG